MTAKEELYHVWKDVLEPKKMIEVDQILDSFLDEPLRELGTMNEVLEKIDDTLAQSILTSIQAYLAQPRSEFQFCLVDALRKETDNSWFSNAQKIYQIVKDFQNEPALVHEHPLAKARIDLIKQNITLLVYPVSDSTRKKKGARYILRIPR